jgi:Zn-dependent protease with chaperone function
VQPAEFHRLVTSLEALGRSDPAALRRRVLGWMWIGDVFLGVLLLLLLAIGPALVWGFWRWSEPGHAVMIALVFALLYLVIGHALVKWWVGLDQPMTLREVPRDRAPRLWARLAEIRRALRAPRVHSIRLIADHNAALVREWRWFPLPHRRFHLVLGVPLLHALRPEQLDAVIAHELAHTFGWHPSLRRRLSNSWRIWERFDVGPMAPPIVRTRGLADFVRWYVPRLSAHTTVASRIAEFEADATSVRVTDALTTARSLAAIHVSEWQLSEFWKRIWEGLERDAAPPATSWSALPEAFRGAHDRRARGERLARALAAQGLVEDSHPSLRERIAAVGVRAPDGGSLEDLLLEPLDESAAEHYLESYAGEVLREWEREWLDDATKQWEDRRQQLVVLRQRLDELLARELAGDPLTRIETWHAATAALELGEETVAADWLRRTIALDDAHAEAHFALGRLLLSQRDAAGAAHVERAMALDLEAAPSGAALLRQFHASQGDGDAALESDSKAQPLLDRLQDAVTERSGAWRDDVFVAPVLSEDDEARLVLAASDPRVRFLWVGRKVLRLSAERELLVIVIQPRNPLHTPTAGSLDDLYRSIHESLARADRDTLVYWWGGNEWIIRRIRQSGGLAVDGRKASVAPRPLGLIARHAPKLWWAAGVSFVALMIWAFTYAPMLAWDPHAVLGEPARREWDRTLYFTRDEVSADLWIKVDSAPRRLLPRYWAEIEYERGTSRDPDDGFGALIAYDLRTRRPWIATGPELARFAPAHFTEGIVQGYADADGTGSAAEPPDAVLRDIFTVLRHRIREASLEPRIPLREVPPSTAPLAPDDLAAAPTAREALARYRKWVARAGPDVGASILTAESRAALARSGSPSPLMWAHLRHLYVGEPMGLRERGDLAVAFATTNPLVPPLFFRRGADGWQADRVAESVEVEPITGGDFAWGLTRDGPYADAFDDEIRRVERVHRFKGGANNTFHSCGCARP